MILQVLPVIIPHTSNGGSCANLPQWIEIGLWVLLGLILLALLILLIKLIFDF